MLAVVEVAAVVQAPGHTAAAAAWALDQTAAGAAVAAVRGASVLRCTAAAGRYTVEQNTAAAVEEEVEPSLF
jgi:hypothetical protein